MKDSSNGSTKLIALVLLLAVLAGGAYFFLSPKSDVGTDTAPVASEETAPATTPDVTATEPTPAEPTAPIVVETKTLNIPAAPEPTIPTAEKSTDPAVELMMGLRKIGSDTAPIKIVEYSSLTCGHCSSFHKNDFPKIKTDYIDTGKVQFIFKEFPLNKPALDASKILRCMPEDKFMAFQGLLFDEQDKWAYQADYLVPLKQNAKLAGLTEEQIETCLNNKALEDRLVGDAKAGTEKFKIQSTPTFIVNDGAKVIVGHQPMSVFEETFKAILSGTPIAPAAPAAPEADHGHDHAPAPAPTEAPAPSAEPAPVAPTPVTEAAPAAAPDATVAADAPAEPVKD